MICHRIGNAIICRGRSPRARCSAGGGCDRPHTRLCDFPVGRGRTCDLKLCDQHTKRTGETDLCPFHAKQMRLDLGGGR